MLGVDPSSQTATKPRARDRAAPACPHLGLASDQFAHFGGASPEHRCYLWMARERIDRAHQQRYCLTDAHAACPWKVVTRRHAGEREGLGTQLSGVLRDRFDNLERATVRATWPRAILAVLAFAAVMLATSAREAARVAFPYLRRAVWSALRLGRQGLKLGGPRLVRASGILMRCAGGAARSALARIRARRPRPPVPSTPRPVLGVEDLAAVPIDPVEVEPVRSDVWVPLGVWTCGYCRAENSAQQEFCPRCYRLADELEAYLRRENRLDLLSGLKAVEVGGESRAFRQFVAATTRYPGDTLAWRWRARTAPTISQVIIALEQLILLDPTDTQVQADLAIARSRYHGERTIAAPAASEAKAPPAQPRLGNRILDLARHLSLELASIPSFALGILVAGAPVRDLLSMLSLDDYARLLPSYALPSLIVRLPPSLQPDLLPDLSTNLVGLGLVAFAVWYLYLAFRLTDGSPGSRWPSLAAGVVALGSLRVAVAGTAPLLACAVLLTVLAAIGREAPRDTRARIVRQV